MNILSIQSWVAYGHVGNSSAVFPLQRLGAEVWAINTVQFSNHTGYGSWRGQVFGADLVHDLVQGVADRGVLDRCDAVLSGYMGDATIGDAILSATTRVKAANAQAIYCCDPVIGDKGRGIFVRAGIPEFIRDQAVPLSDILTPNQFELEWMTGRKIQTLDDAKTAVETLRAAMAADGPRVVLVTSLELGETPGDCIEMLAAGPDGYFRIRTPRLPLSVNGAGDAIAALFLFHRLRSLSTATALSRAASSIYGILRRTCEAGSREILTVAAQDEFVVPSHVFDPEPC
ncbi:pyridoxal kinase PdxY [Pseudoroseomonas globiformis]|uniref:pyridoxal kinase n=1 Tax=Teichococcus globiformis TaxID=2307229 RepID=A0ABV7G129_9PROT